MRRYFLDYDAIAFFHILLSSSFIRHPNIQCYLEHREIIPSPKISEIVSVFVARKDK
jgi:hypothetical protein